MLSAIVFSPLLLGASLFFVPKKFLQKTGLFYSLIYLLFTSLLFWFFDYESAKLQLVEMHSVLPFLGIKYFLGIDGISFWYVILTSFLLPFTMFFSKEKTSPLYFFLFFSLCSMLQGAFLSFDSILLFIFFEMTLLPLFFLIYLWGGSKRSYAAFKFLIYTFFGSLFMLVGLVALMLLTKESLGVLSASLLDFYKLDLVFVSQNFFNTQTLLFFCFALAFSVKTPLFPLHTWLPLAHTEAPTSASVYLAAVLLKIGTYGWFRFVLPLFPEASVHYSSVLLFLASIGLIYTSLLACQEKDMKKLIAYSSVAHMSYVLLGLFSFNIYGLQGAYYQTLSHALSSGLLFYLVGLFQAQTGSRYLPDLGGVAKKAPLLACLFFLAVLSAIALPLTGSFVAEFLVLLGSFLSGESWFWLAVTGLVLSAYYMLTCFRRAFLSEASPLVQNTKDINLKSTACLSLFIVLIFAMGIFPSFFLKYSKKSLEHLDKTKFHYRLNIYKTPRQP